VVRPHWEPKGDFARIIIQCSIFRADRETNLLVTQTASQWQWSPREADHSVAAPFTSFTFRFASSLSRSSPAGLDAEARTAFLVRPRGMPASTGHGTHRIGFLLVPSVLRANARASAPWLTIQTLDSRACIAPAVG
jgi:hypothetical protein